MGSAIPFYENVVPLNRGLHAGLRIRPVDGDYRFAARTNSVLLAGAEFKEACKEYPIVFSRTAAGDLVPVALLGIRSGDNVFVKDKQWRARYIPAFVRRYPFLLAEGSGAGSVLTVCLDAGYAGLNEGDGEALFLPNGDHSPYLQTIIGFLKEFREQCALTARFVEKLQAAGLLTEHTAQYELASGESYALSGVFIVDEQALLARDDATILELFRHGRLAWIYCHLVSLSNLGRLIDLHSG